MDATIYKVRHSLTFNILLGGYNRYIIKAANGNQLRSSSIGWYDKYGGEIRERLDHAGKNYWDSYESQFVYINYWYSGDSYSVDDQYTFDNLVNDGGLFLHGDGNGEYYDDLYGNNKGSGIHYE